MRDDTLPLSHFEALYSRNPDPWHFTSSAYEAAKYDATIAALPRTHYGQALEIGCSIGVLTERLAERCRALQALEPVETALAAAVQRNARHPHVSFAAGFVPRDWPDGTFDLVVLSEVLDYLGAADLHTLVDRLRQTLAPEGDVVMVHWVGKKACAAADPSEASEALIAGARDFLRPLSQARNADYRLDVLRRCA